jgi:hypothetical protein
MDEICDYVEDHFSNELNHDLVPGRANQTKWRKAMTNILRRDVRFIKAADGEYTVSKEIKEEFERLGEDSTKEDRKKQRDK